MPRVLRSCLSLSVLLLLTDTAFARDPITRPDVHVKKTRPPAEGAATEAPAEPVVAEPAVEDAPPDPLEEGLSTWVRRIEGDGAGPVVVTPEVEHEIEEREEEQAEDLRLIDGLSLPSAAPVAFYDNPKKALSNDPLHLADVDPSEFDIPIVINDDVVRWMEYFTGSGRKYYERWMSRSTRYRPMMYREIAERGAPKDLVYLSMIESGYSPHAYSTADAAGLWQFIASTGRLYDLRIDSYIDERRDPELATIAGVDHLMDLYEMFDDWYLAWAAYNAGPGRVKRATEKAGSKDFWVLEDGPYLHPETDNYVPKLIAAAIIGHHPEWYGFDNIHYQDALQYDKATVPGNMDIGVLAKCAGITVEEFQVLNPALRRTATPPEGYEARVPVGSVESFLAKVEAVPASERVAAGTHTVRRGETLSIIAAKYDTTVADVVAANHLRNQNMIEVGQQLVIPRAGAGSTAVVARRPEPPATTRPSSASYVTTRSESTAMARSAPAKAVAEPEARPVTPKYHTVRSGDTLTEIAGRYDTSVSQVKAWNDISGDKILVGQRLKVGATSGASTVAASAPAASSSSSSSSPTSSTRVSYVVQKGDALSEIAEQHGVALSSVQKWNKISNASSIYAGQRLTIYVPASAWTKYTVRSGDSLGEIATKYNCSVTELRTWNELDGTVIHPGQVLKVKKG